MSNETVTGNYFDKRKSQNFIVKKLMKKFDDNLLYLLNKIETPQKILEIGCGEGDVVSLVKNNFKDTHYVAVDIDDKLLEQAKEKGADEICLISENKFEIPFKDESFDLILMIEVLEHLPNPDEALSEVRRLADDSVVISVPFEPYWRMLNMLRLKYIKDFGNTPGHINHFGKSSLKKLLSKYFSLEDLTVPFPWLMALLKKD